MKIKYHIVIFDKEFDDFISQIDMPSKYEENYKRLFGNDYLYGSHLIDIRKKLALEKLVNTSIPIEKYDCFFEASGDYTLDLSDCEWIPADPKNPKPAVEPIKLRPKTD